MASAFTNDFSTEHLSGKAKLVAEVILANLAARFAGHTAGEPISGHGCKVFHQGNDLGYGRGAILTICHEGTDVDGCFSMDKCYETAEMMSDVTGAWPKNPYDSYEKTMESVKDLGVFIEAYNSCVSLVYSV